MFMIIDRDGQVVATASSNTEALRIQTSLQRKTLRPYHVVTR